MTSYNHAHLIGDAIESVVRQDFEDWELWIVDDCSTDQTQDVVQSYLEQDTRICFFPNEKNQGQSVLFDEYFSKIESTYVAMLDSDDSWQPTKLYDQLAVINDDSSIGVVYSDAIIIDDRSMELRSLPNAGWPLDVDGKLFSKIHRNPTKREGNLLQELMWGHFMCFSSTFIRTELIAQIPVARIRRSPDWMIFIELAKLCHFAYIEKPLTNYRIHGNNKQDQANIDRTIAVEPREYLLSNYAGLIPNRAQAIHLRQLGRQYLLMDDYFHSRNLLFRSLSLNPVDMRSWYYLAQAIIHM
ncbi:MAG: glycosyltransferase [Chloroflexota bacterium]